MTTHASTAAAPAIARDRRGVGSFIAGVRGTVLRPGDAGYDEARRIWNGMIDRRPALIVRCEGAADVAACVNFAREEGLPLAVRGGGHNVAGTALCDGGLVIDLSPMKAIRVDPDARTVRAGPGLLWGEFDRETQAFGLAAPGASSRTRASPGSPSAAASAGSCAGTGSPATTSSRPRS